MNENNYASREASQRLHDAGIVLETDYHWVETGKNDWILTDYGWKPFLNYSAPSMAEVWKELPEHYKGSQKNPTDALIDLLIFVRKEEKNAKTKK